MPSRPLDQFGLLLDDQLVAAGDVVGLHADTGQRVASRTLVRALLRGLTRTLSSATAHWIATVTVAGDNVSA